MCSSDLSTPNNHQAEGSTCYLPSSSSSPLCSSLPPCLGSSSLSPSSSLGACGGPSWAHSQSSYSNYHPPFFFCTRLSLPFLLLCSLFHCYSLSFCFCSLFFLLCSLFLFFLHSHQCPQHLLFFPRCLFLCLSMCRSCSFEFGFNLFAGHSGIGSGNV